MMGGNVLGRLTRFSSVVAFGALLAFGVRADADPDPGAKPEAEIVQIELTDAQVKAYIAAQRELSGGIFRIPENGGGARLPLKSDSAIESVVRQSGFRDFDEYKTVARNITLVLEGVDPATRSFVGADSMLRRQLADVDADAAASSIEKTIGKAELDAELKALAPIRFPSNIAVVMRNLDAVMANSPYGAAFQN